MVRADFAWSNLGLRLAILEVMRDLLEDIDEAWFSDTAPEVPASGPHSLESLRRPAPAAGALTPMPIPGHNGVSPQNLREFARPSLALRTLSNFPTPDQAWFSEMRSLVPSRMARSSTLPPLGKRTSTSLLAGEETDVPRQSWWRRLRKSKNQRALLR